MVKSAAAEKPAETDFFDVELPENGQEIIGDVNGYIDFKKSAVRFKPTGVKMFDSNLDAEKASILIIGVLTAKAPVYLKGDEEEDEEDRVFRIANVGEPVGVWFKPDLRKLRDKCGTDCYVKLTDKTKKMKGKQKNPMKIYKVVAADGGTRIPILEDLRKESKGKRTPFDTTMVKSKPENEDADFNPDDFEDDIE